MTQSSSYSRDDLVKCGLGDLFGQDKARLPRDNMLMLDRIVSITADGGTYQKGEIIAELDIKPELWFFDAHFADDPVMPGCLGLDAMWQLSGFFLAWSGYKGKGRALGVGEVKFTGQVLPTSKIVSYHLSIKRIMVRKLVLIVSDGTLSVDGRLVYRASSLKVGLFESTDDF